MWWDSGDRLLQCRNYEFPASSTKDGLGGTLKEIFERDTDGGGGSKDGVIKFPTSLSPNGDAWMTRLNESPKAEHPSFQLKVVEHGLLPRPLQHVDGGSIFKTRPRGMRVPVPSKAGLNGKEECCAGK